MALHSSSLDLFSPLGGPSELIVSDLVSDGRCNDIGLAIAVKRSTFAGRALATPFAMACNGKTAM